MTLSFPSGILSSWKMETYGSGGLYLGLLAAAGGEIILKDPSVRDQTFYYGGLGVGIAEGLKIPKLGKIEIPTPKGAVTAAGGPTFFPTTGTVITHSKLPSGDLTKSDIQGLCLFAEVGGGVIGGESGTAMFVGLNPIYLAIAPTFAFGPTLLINSAKGLILMAGLNVGIQAQVGVSACLGYLR